jgi:hypothetical protein
LIEDADGGTPQRFVWLPTDDPDAPDEPDEAPRAIDLRSISQGWPEPGTIRPHIITLPERAQQNAVPVHLRCHKQKALDIFKHLGHQCCAVAVSQGGQGVYLRHRDGLAATRP